jgi:hypothetical protein
MGNVHNCGSYIGGLACYLHVTPIRLLTLPLSQKLEIFVITAVRPPSSTQCGLYFENCLYQALSYLTYARCQLAYVWEELTA